VTLFSGFFGVSCGWFQSLRVVPGGGTLRQPFRGLLFSAQTCSLERGISIGLGVWVTLPVILVGVPVASVQETLNVHYDYLQDE
jgi:hypothetical protein